MSQHGSRQWRRLNNLHDRYRAASLAVAALLVLGSGSCGSPESSVVEAQKKAAGLYGATWIIPPVIQQTHTIGATSDFSVLYTAVGGSCNGNTTIPCVNTNHTLFYRVHGTNTWSTVQLPAYPQGQGYLVTDAHMGDGSVDCQTPQFASYCGTNTTYYDSGPGWTPPLEANFPPWKVIKVSGLQPNVTYDWYVQIDGDNVNIANTTSALGSVKTPPLHNAQTAPTFKFVFNSDPQGSTPGDTGNWGAIALDNQRRDNVLSAIQTYSKPDFMISGGDLGLDGGATKLGTHWFNDATSGSPSIPTSIFSTIPFFPAFGNHDWMSAGSLDHADCCEGGHGFIPVSRDWLYTPTGAMMYGYTTGGFASLGGMYTNPNATPAIPYYSFDWGNSHFLILSTGPDNKGADWNLVNGPNVYKTAAHVGVDSVQFAFAKADLAAASADPNTKHIFVAMHDPIFHPTGDSNFPVNYAPHTDFTSPPPTCGPYETCPNSVGLLTSLFAQYHVDMVLGGHVHTYSEIQDQGVWYITAGIAAGPIDEVENYPGTHGQLVPTNGCNTTGSWGCAPFTDDGGPNHQYGFARQFWGYVEITVSGSEVSYVGKQVIAGTSDGSSVNPPPIPSTVDSFQYGVNPANNVTAALHNPTTGLGGVDITYYVNSYNSGSVQLYMSTTGIPNSFAYQAGFDTPYLANTPTTQHTINYPNVTPGQTLYFQLRSLEGYANYSAMSQTASILIPACAMPPINVTNSPAGNVITWAPYSCPGVTTISYSVYRNDNNAWNGIGVALGADTFTDTAWTCGSDQVDYKVVAWTSTPQNQLVWSVPAYGSSGIPFNPACAPTTLTAMQLTQSQMQLNWSNNGQAFDSIQVERGVGIFCNNTKVIATLPGGSALSYVDNAVAANTLYCYSLNATIGATYYFSNVFKIKSWQNQPPLVLHTNAIGANQIALNWTYPPGSAATGTTIYRTLTPSDATSWEPIVTLPNVSANGRNYAGSWTDTQTSANEDFNHWWYGTNTDATYYYQAVGHVYAPSTDPNQSIGPDTTSYATTLADNASVPTAAVSVTPRNTSACASGPPDTVFSPGVEACPGSVTYPNAVALCAPGYSLCSAAQWDATFQRDDHVPPANNYWLADNLGFAGSGPNNCSVSGAIGDCGTNDPMRVCGSTSDAQGNACNWTGCGYTSNSVNGVGSEYFGGCAGNMTAGALCCLNTGSSCSSEASASQQFAAGVVGCAGKVTWDKRNDLCGQGCTACGANQYVQYSGGARPAYDYWTNDNLGYAGVASACGALTIGGNSCGTNDPMRICVPATTTDPLGNVCNWHDCGFNGVPPQSGDAYFGGCSGNTTAGTLCCCDQ